jgi:predicted PurR-regulated permease PerM
MKKNSTEVLLSIRNVLIIFLVILIFFVIQELSSILIPLVLAILFAVLFQPLIMFLRRKKVPKLIILPTISIITLGILFGVGMIISDTASKLVEQQDYLLTRLVAKIELTLDWINSIAGSTLNMDSVVDELYKNTNSDAISNTLSGIAVGLGNFFGSFAMFALYYVLLLAGMSEYKRYIGYVGGDDNGNLLREYENIQHSVFSYMYIKTIISLTTGLFTFLTCYFFGIKFALFWGFTAFLLNFIPSIGSIIGTVFPILMSIIQFDSFQPIFFLAIILTSIQFTLGNLVEPIIMGSRLRLNTLTVIFGLVFWGYIWGITGMILSVPMLVIMKIILERFSSFSIVGRIMGYPDKNSTTNIINN